MRTTRLQSAFSLLELIIVLMVMIGMLAIVWPNLQRPLSRTTLSEAAQVLREVIDESRYQATITGTPQFVHLQQGESEFQTGAFADFFNSDSDSSSATRLESQAIGTDSQRATTWQLPTTVIISNVQWATDATASTRRQSSSTAFNEEFEVETGPNESAANPNNATTGAENLSGGNDLPADFQSSNLQWWLPLLASGQGRDASIELLDTQIQQSLTVTYVSATGALEISR